MAQACIPVYRELLDYTVESVKLCVEYLLSICEALLLDPSAENKRGGACMGHRKGA